MQGCLFFILDSKPSVLRFNFLSICRIILIICANSESLRSFLEIAKQMSVCRIILNVMRQHAIPRASEVNGKIDYNFYYGLPVLLSCVKVLNFVKLYH